MEQVSNVASFIGLLKKITEERNGKHSYLQLYRGEPRSYSIPGKPGIYREDYLVKNPFFEKNLLVEMTANRITSGVTYLEKAVDAQHDEFPSRLLDVTYNALVALYFAVTPYYKKYDEDAYDDTKGNYDGQVIIYFLKHIYCPGAKNIEDTFDGIIDRNRSMEHPLLQENHKLIDHIKLNTRICVQQGAFILFQGDEYTPISKKDYEIIKIPSKSKKKIREELDLFFGINTGFIYPEPYNLTKTLINKAKLVKDSVEEMREEEILLFLDKVHEEILYGFNKIVRVNNSNEPFDTRQKELLDIVMEIEANMKRFAMELKDFIEIDAKREEYTGKYNDLVCQYYNWFYPVAMTYGITISKDEIMI